MSTKHLYIHYPFCKKKCSYCDFISFAKHESFIKKYHEALINEILWFSRTQSTQHNISTIFIGGGTPSLYPIPLLSQLFDTLHKNFSLTSLKEVTIETNPGDITKDHLAAYKNLGINRLSIGVQLLDETILQSVNRHQTNKTVKDLLRMAPTYFDNISVDLILGLPNTTTRNWFQTLEYVTSCPITHISVYFLTIYDKTPLYFKVKSHEITLPEENWMIDTYTKTIEFLEQKNFFQYEISNFAKPNYQSIHNKAYWDRKPYRGFGLSAASFDGKNRLVNSNNLVEYLHCWKTPEDKQRNCFTQETLTPENALLEELMLGLRQKRGVDLRRMVYYVRRTAKTQQKLFEKRVQELQEQKLLEEKNGRIFLTTRGMVLENEVIIKLLD